MPTTLDEYFPFSAGAGASVSETQWRQMARTWFPTGVVDNAISLLNEMAVTQRSAGANMSIDVATGWAWVLGTFGANTSVKNITIGANVSGNPRIDRIVVRADFVNDRVELDVVAGTPAGSPSAPALTQSSSMWEISLAQVSVANGAASIVDANITSEREVMGQLEFINDAANFADKTLQRPLLKDIGEDVHAHGNTGATETIDIENGNVHTITLDANCTLTFSNPTATGDSCSFTLIVLQDGTGSRTVTWPASVKWAGGIAPVLTTTAGRYDVFTFTTVDAGTRWFGFVAGLNFA